MNRLALFDLDNTLLTGDSEVLWVDYLLGRGLLDERLAAGNTDMDRRYHAGQATPAEFCAFYASVFGGRTPAEWAPLLAEFIDGVIAARLPAAAHELIRGHRDRGDTLVLTTASSRLLSEPTARLLGFDNLIATELALHDDGRLTGHTTGTLNMREGKVERMLQWLEQNSIERPADALQHATFYSDSINDLPLLLAVGDPVVVDPDARLEAEARARHWPVLRLPRQLLSVET